MSKPCPDCGAPAGYTHEPGCDVARCTNCGRQDISCDCDPDDPIVAGMPRDRWSGEWPGVAECREFGFWTTDGMEDLNRLVCTCRWDRAKQRWVRP